MNWGETSFSREWWEFGAPSQRSSSHKQLMCLEGSCKNTQKNVEERKDEERREETCVRHQHWQFYGWGINLMINLLKSMWFILMVISPSIPKVGGLHEAQYSLSAEALKPKPSSLGYWMASRTFMRKCDMLAI